MNDRSISQTSNIQNDFSRNHNSHNRNDDNRNTRTLRDMHSQGGTVMDIWRQIDIINNQQSPVIGMYRHCTCSLAENAILILSNSEVIQNLINMNSIHIYVIFILFKFFDQKNILKTRHMHF